MSTIGYALLLFLGVMGARAFSPKLKNANQTVDVISGAKVFDSMNINTMTKTIVQGKRVPATPLDDKSMYCPIGTTLYKDSRTGQFWCYEETADDTAGSYTTNEGPAPADAIVVAASQVVPQTMDTITTSVQLAPVGESAKIEQAPTTDTPPNMTYWDMVVAGGQ